MSDKAQHRVIVITSIATALGGLYSLFSALFVDMMTTDYLISTYVVVVKILAGLIMVMFSLLAYHWEKTHDKYHQIDQQFWTEQTQGSRPQDSTTTSYTSHNQKDSGTK